jgi:LPXTG-motif cell wall-anchored protein
MKAKKFFVVALVMAILAVPTFAFAATSPTVDSKPAAEIVVGEVALDMADNPNLTNVQIVALTPEVEVAVLEAVTEVLGEAATGTVLETFDLSFDGSGPVTVQVSGVSPSDTIVVVHTKDDGTVAVYPARVLADGKIEFTPDGNSPFAIVRVTSGTVVPTATTTVTTVVYPIGMYLLPQTGEASSVLPMALLLVSLAVLGLGVAMLRRNQG